MLHIPENNPSTTTTKSAENVRWMFLDSPSAVRNTLSATRRGKGAVESWEQAGQARSFLKSLMQTATYALLDHPLRYRWPVHCINRPVSRVLSKDLNCGLNRICRKNQANLERRKALSTLTSRDSSTIACTLLRALLSARPSCFMRTPIALAVSAVPSLFSLAYVCRSFVSRTPVATKS
jgi:hypothetical protein